VARLASLGLLRCAICR
jgi:hypothetical protein